MQQETDRLRRRRHFRRGPRHALASRRLGQQPEALPVDGSNRSDDVLCLDLLGPFALRARTGAIGPLPKKAQALLTYLACHAGRPVQRERLAALLWAESRAEQARRSLRQCLMVLRDALGPDGTALASNSHAALVVPADQIRVDVRSFEALSRSNELADLQSAAELYRDEFLVGFQVTSEAFDDWVAVERQRLASIASDVLYRLASLQAGSGDLERAIFSARRLRAIDPLREDAHRLLTQILVASGRRSAALEQHEQYVSMLRRELGVAPDAETTRLADAIRLGAELSPGAFGAFAGGVTSSTHPAPPAGRAEWRPPNGQHAPSSTNKPAIVVLPFVNLSEDSGQDYFADGVVEDITLAIGRETWLHVIGSQSAFALKGSPLDTKSIGTMLGVQYVLRGSIRRERERMRIVVQLVDASHGGHIWSERFDGTADDVFAIQDRLASQVSAMIAPAVRTVEIERAKRKAPESLSAYELYLRALPRFRTSRAENEEALRLLYRAIELDPSYGTAYGLAARCYHFQKVLGWAHSADPRLAEGIRLAHLAGTVGRDDSEALWMAGLALVFLSGEIETGLTWIERSLSLNANCANAWVSSCFVHGFLGDSEMAIEHFSRAQRLNPLDSIHHVRWNAVANAHFVVGRYEQATEAADKTLNELPTYPPGLRMKVATAGLLGRADEARAYVKRLLSVNPDASVHTLEAFWLPILRRSPHALEAYVRGLRLAGLPEE